MGKLTKKQKKFLEELCSDFQCSSDQLFHTYPQHSVLVEDFYFDNVDNRAEFMCKRDIYITDKNITLKKGSSYYIVSYAVYPGSAPYHLEISYDLSI